VCVNASCDILDLAEHSCEQIRNAWCANGNCGSPAADALRSRSTCALPTPSHSVRKDKRDVIGHNGGHDGTNAPLLEHAKVKPDGYNRKFMPSISGSEGGCAEKSGCGPADILEHVSNLSGSHVGPSFSWSGNHERKGRLRLPALLTDTTIREV
jgi:hypothetical protein